MNDLQFLENGSVNVAKQLIGWRLYSREPNGQLVGGTIVETEAYNQDDAASHSYRGETPRTKIMFGASGYIYVYFTYGMHFCMNIVCGKAGRGEAVLIRALRLDEGVDIARVRRKFRPDHELTDGPAKLCQALNITAVDNGAKLNDSRFLLKPPLVKLKCKATTRIGISRDTHRLWRFVVEN